MRSKKWALSLTALLFVFICAIGLAVYGIAGQSGYITASAEDTSTNVTVNSAATYQLFNSGCTSSSGNGSSSSNSAPTTFTNNGYDIYAQYFNRSSDIKTTQIGRTFTVESEITEKVSVSIYAFDVDESSGETDIIYLVDDTSGTSVKVGTLSGMDQQWNTTSFSIDPSNFTTGHTYHLYLSVDVSGWCVWVRTVSIEVSAVSGDTGSQTTTPVVQDASISASISTSGTVTANLSVTSDEDRTLYLEFKATHVSTNNQVGSLSSTIAATASGVNKTYTFSLDSGSPTGTYTVECFIKDSSGNSIKSVSCTVSYNTSSSTKYYAVSYNSNGGSSNLPQDTKSYLAGATVTVLFDYVPSKSGYTFLGWSQSSSATAATYTEGGTTTFTMGSSDVTLYAVWEKVSNTGFQESGGNTYYYVDGTSVTGYYIINNNIYYFGTDGAMSTNDGTYNYTSDGYIGGTQFVEVNNNMYYIVDGTVTIGYYIINNNIYYFGTDGAMSTNDGTYNYTSDGYIGGTQFVEINNNTYYIVNGSVTIGYYIINNNIYYFGTDGAMSTNDGTYNYTSDGYISGTQFVEVNNNTYYIVNGEITIGYYIINNNIYYFGTDGAMGSDGTNNFTSDGYVGGTKFVEVNNNTYYIVNGDITIGYYIINNNIYYFGTDGAMSTDGEHKFTSDGYVGGTQFIEINNNTYYIVDGTVTIGYYIINNNIYYFGTDGAMGEDGEHKFTTEGYVGGTQFFEVNNNTYYIVDGSITIGYYIINNNIYYFGTDGAMGEDGEHKFTTEGYVGGTEFIVINNNTYYIVDGSVTIGYYIINNNIYYFGTDGAMGEDGKNSFTSEGYVGGTQFVEVNNNTYYIVNGTVTIGYYIINNNIYYFGTDGAMGSDGTYSFTSEGYIKLAEGFVEIDSGKYYLVDNSITEGFVIYNSVLYICADGSVEVYDLTSGTEFSSENGIEAKISIYNNTGDISSYKFSAETVNNESMLKAITNLLDSDKISQLEVYDISLYDNGGSYVSGNLAAEINLPVPSGWSKDCKLTAYWYDTENNAVVEMPVEVGDDGVALTTNHFSYYVLVVEDEAATAGGSSNGSTGSGSSSASAGSTTDNGSVSGSTDGTAESGSTSGETADVGTTDIDVTTSVGASLAEIIEDNLVYIVAAGAALVIVVAGAIAIAVMRRKK